MSYSRLATDSHQLTDRRSTRPFGPIVTDYDNETRCFVDTGSYPDRSSRDDIVVNGNGSTDLNFGPTPPAGKPEHNWITGAGLVHLLPALRADPLRQELGAARHRRSEVKGSTLGATMKVGSGRVFQACLTAAIFAAFCMWASAPASAQPSPAGLYVVLGLNRALRYGIGVGRDGFTWSGVANISRKEEWPDWRPPPRMIERQPYLPRFVAGGEGNPLGARAFYLGQTVFRIRGHQSAADDRPRGLFGLLPNGQ